MLTAEDLRDYEAIAREPLSVRYRGRDVLTNPPPSAGGILLAVSLQLLDQTLSPPPLALVVRAMEEAQSARTAEFVEGLGDPGVRRAAARRRGWARRRTSRSSTPTGARAR